MKRYITPWIALAVGLVLTMVASLEVKQVIEQDMANELAFTSDQVTLKIQERLDAYALILKGGAGLFAASNAVDRRAWQAYVEKLRSQDSLPGVQGVGFSQVIPPQQLAAHIARVRAEGFPDYTVRPAGERALYTSIIYLEPFRDRNLRAFGFDMFSEPVRRAAMEQARDSGAPALSGKVELVQETATEVQAGTLMYVPVYRNGAATDTVEQRRAALIGWSYSPYRMQDLMEGILAKWADHKTKRVHLHIYAGPEVQADSLLYDSHPAVIHTIDPRYYQQRTIDFNGQHWLLALHTGEGVVTIRYANAWATLAGGILLSSLLCALMLALARTQVRARKIADSLTEELRKSESFLRSTVDGLSAHIAVLDDRGAIILTNQAYRDFAAQNGIEPRTVSEGTNYLAVCDTASGEHSVEATPFAEGIREVLAGQRQSFALEYPCDSPSEKRWFIAHVTQFSDEGPRQVIVAHENITERKQAEEALRLAANVFTHAREGITITDRDANILDVNAAFTDITGYSREEVLGKNPRILNSGKQDKAFYAAMWHDLLTKGHWYGEMWNRRKDGVVVAEMKAISAVRDERGEIQNYIALFSDITTIKEHQAQLEYIAHYDTLTGLPNRLLLGDRLRQAMSQAPRRGERLAVAFLDLDGFKAVNDTHGHEVGDQLLATLAKRMIQVLRAGDTLGRLGGDEFVAVLVDLSDVEASVPILTRLLEAAAQPFPVGDLALNVSASLGVTFYPQSEAVDADQLLRQADQAMYQAKQAGKNRYHAFDAEQDRNVRGHHESLEHIRQALAERQFVLYYQPKVNMRTGEVIGAEALIRWQHPQRGLLLPEVFLPVIENHPLAIDLGEWVIDSALTQIEAWRADGLPIPVSVNVGALQLQHPDFVSCLRTLLARHPGVNPGELELEILETSALEDFAGVSQVMAACQALGVGFALDDFGTGYSSLTYLKQLPAGLLKIDQSFVCDMLDDPNDLAILEGVLGLALAFRRQVIVEGVETLAHGEMLVRMGCEWAQGYAIARPMPANEFQGWVSAWDTPPSWKALNPISKDRLPVLFAAVEHRAWISEMADYLSGKRDAPPEQDAHHCRFGHWLDHGGRALLLGEGADQLVDALHREIHRLAAELMALQRDGRFDEVQSRISELHRLRDQLLEQLSELY